ncbi:SulP family inorganic anion transporter [Streptomyces sp. MNU76]|uniref:SulP family inorganic anion transporter n=1 Tax=Streptomyces sp. MNU76 TaxID=2560026 RepID=UPI001E39E0FD|nr:SulP family inorganic anion transporter [Streptomyces sp. MNU76]MCC9704350.1 SulP family inorganic anion transporter [Streptomyces sp. MNU76]
MSGAHGRRHAAGGGAHRSHRSHRNGRNGGPGLPGYVPDPPPYAPDFPEWTVTETLGREHPGREHPGREDAGRRVDAGRDDPDPDGPPSGSKRSRAEASAGRIDFGTEITASLVVFLVALPLCIGVAVASGVPAELGIISGVIGGLVVGAVRGSTLQVSGPAAGLAALVAETVMEFGVAMLGVIVLFSGILQIVLGLVKLDRMFQAISIAVVQGMLAGIGLPLMFSQLYPMSDSKAPGTPLDNMAGVPGLIADTVTNPQALIAAGLGIVTIVLSFVWKQVPGPVRKIPAALVAVGIGIAVASLPGVEVKTLQVGNLLASVDVPGPEQLSGLTSAGVITAILTFTVIASAESLFTAAAVDRMHDGPRTRYNTELIAQGAGNTVAGILGALPITAVVARSSANVQAGAKTRLSRTLHGLWLLAFALLLPQVLALIPISVLAGVLVHSGWKLFAPEQFPKMWRQDRGEFAVMTLTTLVITATALLEGVLFGLAAGVVLAALRMSQTVIRQHIEDDTAKVVMAGNATFLRLPKLIDALEGAAASGKPRIRLDLLGVTHLDHACRSQIEEFVAQQRGAGLRVELLMPDLTKSPAAAEPKGAVAEEPAFTGTAEPEREPEPVPTEVWDYATVGTAAVGGTGRPMPTGAGARPGRGGPGPDAEWFYLDTRPMPGCRRSGLVVAPGARWGE